MDLGTLISDQNPQWVDSQYAPVESTWPKRETFARVRQWFPTRFVLALTGIRRVGKSTLMRQLIGELLQAGNARRCLYFSFEKLQFKRDPDVVRAVVDWYLAVVLAQKSYALKERVTLFFDEVQNIPDWQEIVKHYYDQNEACKFVVSGSSSLFVKKTSQESLGGRIIEIPVSPLSFREYLALAAPTFTIHPDDPVWRASQIELTNGHFERYLRFGQFPEIVSQNLEVSQAKLYLASIEEKIIGQDLPALFPIAYPEVLRAIVHQIKKNPGARIEYQSIAKDAGVDQRTITAYMEHLTKGFLVSTCLTFGKKPIKAPRVAKKAYMGASNLAYDAPLSALVENYVFCLLKQTYAGVYFQKDKEIDFVAVDERGDPRLFEVKYQNDIRADDTRNLRYGMGKMKPRSASVITKRHFDRRGPIRLIPAALLEYYFSQSGAV